MNGALSSQSSFFYLSSIEKIKNNFSIIGFNRKEFIKILTTEKFPEEDAKKWISDHFYLTLQVFFYYIDKAFVLYVE